MDNQIYKAPSIPKINRTTIASPFGKGGAVSSGIKLRRSIASPFSRRGGALSGIKLRRFIASPFSRRGGALSGISAASPFSRGGGALSGISTTSLSTREDAASSGISPTSLSTREDTDSSSRIKLRRSTFSFIKPFKRQIDSEKLTQPVVEQTNFIGKELAETNRVLVEIQKQLSLDFGYRIAEEKKAIALEKKRISARRTSDKESRLEKGPKGVLGRTFDAVTAPFKSIFQKLIDFFSIILTGILLNTAFEWLGKKENQAKVKAFFDFVTEYWKELLIIFAAYKLLKLVKAIAGVANTLRRMLKWFKGFKSPIKPPTSPTIPGGKPIGKPPLRSPLERGPGQAPIPRPAPPRPILGPTGRPAITNPLSRYSGPGSAPARAPGIPKPGQGITPPPPSPKGKIDFSKFTGGGLRMAGKFLRMIGLAFLADEISKDYEKGDYKAIAVKLSAYGLGWLTTALLATGGLAAAGTGVGTVPGVAIVGSSVLAGAGVDAGVRAAFGYSQGGTVGQGDRAGTDTVPTQNGFLDTGEEVIRTSSAMIFRPLLKDINENAGRMWQQFTQAVTKLIEVTNIQKNNGQKFKEVIENYNQILKDQIQELKRKNDTFGEGGGSGNMNMPIKSSFNSSVSAKNNINQKSSNNIGATKIIRPTLISKQPTPVSISLKSDSMNSEQTSLRPTLSSTPKLTPIVNNIILNSSKRTPNIVTVNLPPEVIKDTKSNKIPTYPGKSNEVPNIIPFDLLNPWMSKESISERYGVAYGI